MTDKAPHAFRDASEMFEVDSETHPSWLDGTFEFKVHDNMPIANNLNRNKVTKRVTVKDSAEEAASKAAAVVVLKQLLPVLEGLLARQQAAKKGAQSDATQEGEAATKAAGDDLDADDPNRLIAPSARAAQDARVRATIAFSQKAFDEKAAEEDAQCDAMGIDRPRRTRWNPMIGRFTK